MPSNWSWLGPLLTLVSFIAMGGVTVGILRTTVKDLADKVKNLADKAGEVESIRTAMAELKAKHEALAAEVRPQVVKISEHTAMLALGSESKKQEISQLHTALAAKASKESVDGLKEQLSEIKGMLTTMTMTVMRGSDHK